MKKLLAGLLAVLTAAAAFSGCSGTGNAASNSAGTGTSTSSAAGEKQSVSSAGIPTDKVTLRFEWWGGDDRHKPTLDAIKKFEEKYPYITIKGEYGGFDGMQEKVNTQMAGHTAPDIIQLNYDWIASLSRDGMAFVDLQTMKDIVDLSQWDADTLKFGMRNGKLNAITVSTTGRSWYYNKTTFDKVGVAIPKTWDDLLAAGQTFEKYNKSYYPTDLDTGSGFTAFYAVMAYEQQKTGKEFLSQDGKIGFTVDEFKDALDFYQKLEKSHVTRTQKQQQNDNGSTALYQTDNFISGKVAGMIEWSSSVGKFAQVLNEKKNQLVIGDLLTLPDAKNAGWFVKPSLLIGINAETKYPKQAALFLNWLLNDPESSVILGTSRGIPSSHSALEALTKSNAKLADDLAYQGTVQINNAKPVLESPYMDNAEIKKSYIAAIQSVSYETSDTQKAAQTLYDSMQKTLDDIVE